MFGNRLLFIKTELWRKKDIANERVLHIDFIYIMYQSYVTYLTLVVLMLARSEVIYLFVISSSLFSAWPIVCFYSDCYLFFFHHRDTSCSLVSLSKCAQKVHLL